MTGHLLLVIFIYSIHEIKAQALLPPKLTVNPPVITETDSVTLNCQTPISVSVCYFHIRRKPAKPFSCLKTLTGTELLKIANQSPPAEVKVTCFYLVTNQSPDSYMSSIIIRTSLRPKLTVNPPVITETDSVTLNCQTPTSVSVSRCYFYILNGGTVRSFSCLQTLTATELLKLAHQSSPAEVKVKCYYTVKFGETDSSHSDSSSITIYSQKPQMTHQYFYGDSVLFTCSLSGSANHDARCNLYFGEASHPVTTTTIRREKASSKRWFCQFTVPIDDLLTHLRFFLRKDASCDYTLGSEPNSLSPRSDGLNLTDIVEIESSKMQTTPTLTMTTGLTVTTPRASTPLTPAKSTSGNKITGWTTGSSTVTSSSTFSTSVKPSETDTGMTDNSQGSGDEIKGSSVSKPGTKESPLSDTLMQTKSVLLRVIAVVAGCGVTVGVILLVSAIIWNQRRAGSKEPKTREPQNKDSDTGRVYCEIAQEPTAFALKDTVYSTVEAH